MKRKILLCILSIMVLFTLCGCTSTTKTEGTRISNKIQIKDVTLSFDQDSEFHDFKYKNINGIEPDESKQAVYLDYINKDLYDGRFVFRISMAFSDETNLNEFFENRTTEDVKINGINWKKSKINNKTDNKDTTSIVYATEKNGTLYAVTTIIFNESGVDINTISKIFINGVTLK